VRIGTWLDEHLGIVEFENLEFRHKVFLHDYNPSSIGKCF